MLSVLRTAIVTTNDSNHVPASILLIGQIHINNSCTMRENVIRLGKIIFLVEKG